ncbi:hypothetical protein BZG17_27470 [Escherichia coli]|nr:hypothetical protein [Escherichia coli]
MARAHSTQLECPRAIWTTAFTVPWRGWPLLLDCVNAGGLRNQAVFVEFGGNPFNFLYFQ